MYYKIRRILTWTLTAAVVLSSNSVTVLAENEDFSEFQDVEEDVSVTEDEVDFESEKEWFSVCIFRHKERQILFEYGQSP